MFLNKNDTLGAMYSFIAAFLWATYYVISEYMLGDKTALQPSTLAFCRFFSGGLILFIYLYCTARKQLFSLNRKEMIMVAIQSLFSLVLMSSFLFWGQKYTDSVNASMIMMLSPIFTLVIGGLILRMERIGFIQMIGIFTGAAGCILVVTDGEFKFSLASLRGDLLVLISAISWAISTILSKKVTTKENAFAVTVWSMIFASGILAVINGVQLIVMPDAMCMPENGMVWLYLLYLGIFPTALAFYAWYAAVGCGTLNIVNAVQYTESLIAVLLAAVFLDKDLSWIKYTGVFVAIAGVVIAAKFQKAHEKKA